MKKVITFMVLSFLLVLCAVPVYAQGIPALPHAFYGSVEINDAKAPIHTKVEARGDGVATGIAGNPIYTTVYGIYGTSNPYEPRLIVQGDIQEGAPIDFYVNDVFTGQTYAFDSGEVTELPLSVTITVEEEEEEEKGWGEPPSPAYVETDIFGIKGSFRISNTGKILATIEATSEDGMLTLTIPEGTIALDKRGEPLSTLTTAVDESPPDPPEDAHIIGLAYDFGPDGATFDPPITFTWSYDPDALPEGVAEEDLVIAYYDEEADEWVELDCVVDIENNTITASVEHFSIFVILARAAVAPPLPAPAAFSLSDLTVQPAEVEPNEAVTITVSVANTGGTEGSYTVVLNINGVKEADKSVTVAAGGSQAVSFSVTKEEAGSYSVAVNGLSGSFHIAAPPVLPPTLPPAFSLSNLTVQPASVEPGKAVVVSVSVANTGGTEGSYSVVLMINGVKETEKSVTVAAGSSQDVSFTVSKDVGIYSVAIDGLSGSFIVVPPPPPPPPPVPAVFSLSALSIQPASVESGEAVSITVSVANTGGMEGSYSVVLEINDVKEAEKSVTVAAGGSQDVNFSVTKEDAGIYSIVVDGLSGSFTVVPLPPVKPPINWPVLAAIIFGVILVALLIFYMVRRRA